MSKYANFLYKVGMLAHTPRFNFAPFGTGNPSIAEHTFRMLSIAFVLNKLVDEPVDELHLFRLVLFHALPEARTSGQNYEHQKDMQVDRKELERDLADELPFGAEILALVNEFADGESAASKIAHDASELEALLSVKEQLDTGKTGAADRVPLLVERLVLREAKNLAEEIISTRSDDWWFSNKQDEHWVTRGKEKNLLLGD